jgi:hypothetical protein
MVQVIPSASYRVDTFRHLIYNVVSWAVIRLESAPVLNQTSQHEDVTRRRCMEVSSNFTSGRFTPRQVAGVEWDGGGGLGVAEKRRLFPAASRSPILQPPSPVVRSSVSPPGFCRKLSGVLQEIVE